MIRKLTDSLKKSKAIMRKSIKENADIRTKTEYSKRQR